MSQSTLDMNENAYESWLKFLNPKTFRENLDRSGIYLIVYELFLSTLIGQPKDFYNISILGEEGEERYANRVLKHDSKHPFNASILWWKEMGAINDEEIGLIHEFRKHRNEIAHGIHHFLMNSDYLIRLDLLLNMIDLLVKMDQWWIREIEIPTNPDFDDIELTKEDYEKSMSGNMIILSLILPILEGDTSKMEYVYEGFREELKK